MAEALADSYITLTPTAGGDSQRGAHSAPASDLLARKWAAAAKRKASMEVLKVRDPEDDSDRDSSRTETDRSSEVGNDETPSSDGGDASASSRVDIDSDEENEEDEEEDEQDEDIIPTYVCELHDPKPVLVGEWVTLMEEREWPNANLMLIQPSRSLRDVLEAISDVDAVLMNPAYLDLVGATKGPMLCRETEKILESHSKVPESDAPCMCDTYYKSVQRYAEFYREQAQTANQVRQSTVASETLMRSRGVLSYYTDTIYILDKREFRPTHGLKKCNVYGFGRRKLFEIVRVSRKKWSLRHVNYGEIFTLSLKKYAGGVHHMVAVKRLVPDVQNGGLRHENVCFVKKSKSQGYRCLLMSEVISQGKVTTSISMQKPKSPPGDPNFHYMTMSEVSGPSRASICSSTLSVPCESYKHVQRLNVSGGSDVVTRDNHSNDHALPRRQVATHLLTTPAAASSLAVAATAPPPTASPFPPNRPARFPKFFQSRGHRLVLRLNAADDHPWPATSANSARRPAAMASPQLIREMESKYPNLSVLRYRALAPLQIKLRDERTTPTEFKFYADRLMRILAEEGLAACASRQETVVTPTGDSFTGLVPAEKVCAVSIIRAGDSLLQSIIACDPTVSVGKILIQRDETSEDKHPVMFYSKLPPKVETLDNVLLVDPMLATGGSVNMAIKVRLEMVVEWSWVRMADACVSADVKVVTAGLDLGLNASKYILPGLGDYGDRYYNTV
ncbi:unnamed protein product [Phytophthora lilii]|uniref:uracil phosphoribosyltransferase n=1 Tax=Phytophthora lilii TaxID=2077276 RepID=A0A9W6X424_9STRA|nr:unnamed protein product [Phytophthora lilii]